MATNYYLPEDKVPLPPKHADVLTTCCDYCIVACAYKVYRWPIGSGDGGVKASENAFGIDFPSSPLQDWVAPAQHNVVMHKDIPHNVIITPNKDATTVNTNGDSSIRGGIIAQKCYNPKTPTRDRLTSPMMRIYGTLQPVPWDFALDVAAEVAKHVIAKHGANAYSVKTYSYQYIENTYAISKFALRHVNTASFTFHDTPSDVTSTPGFRDAGFDNFGPSYDDWGSADVLMCLGTDPYETKTILFTQHIMKGVQKGMKLIMVNPRETAGITYAKKMGGLHLDVYPGSDTVLLGAIARIVVENGWEDKEWIEKWVNNKWESDSGFGQGTRNTPWQWRTTWGKFQTKGFKDYKKWLLSQPEYELAQASEITGVDAEKIQKAAEWIAKPKADGSRVNTSFGIEKGFYWSNNTGNTNAISSLATICGAGGRPGRVVGRFGGHQRGGQRGGKLPRNKSPEKVPGRRRRALDTDRWLVSGHTRMAHVIGTTWIQAMSGSQGLQKRFQELVVTNPHQVRSHDKQEIIETLKRRADSGGMVVIDQDIYLRNPIGAQFADIVFPAATWGEEDFMRANGERRLRLYQKFYDAPGDAKPDWWIIAQLAQRMGFDGFDWKNSNDVAEESSRFSRKGRKAFHMVKVYAHQNGRTLHEQMRLLGADGIQGPTFINDKGELKGAKRLHDTTMTAEQAADLYGENGPGEANIVTKKLTHFNTQTGQINLQKHPWSLFSDFWTWLKPKEDELWLSNGRINEIWQSGFDDVERRPYITQRWPENFVEIHPEDAKARGIESGDYVMMYSERVAAHKDTLLGVQNDHFQFDELMKRGHIELSKAAVTAVAIVTPHVKKGVLYSNMLDTRQPSNALTARVVDHISGNYNYKMGVAKIAKLGASKYKEEFRSMSFAPRNIA
ncbi:arsenate reductase (azurin) large subunit [Candidatus Parabeggiatoa sp. HSG14]|uniref:arsenate reductase (azurin) large subunit n=1 Tax=Candidatus Parabeggiatoa sp. HSG14 TaxID=3055593 RepID=UPI0025A8E316|nr:arsenate reductase (azurin) large subunit [Thiotrichales bacterium HSG14]